MADISFTLDIGEKIIKAADIVKKDNFYVANAMAIGETNINVYSADVKAAEGVIPILKKLVEDANIVKKAVDIIIPNTFSYSRLIETPVLTDKELISAIRYQADQFIPVPINKINMDIEVVSKVGTDKLLILLVAAPNTIIERMTNIIESVGLMPDSIETEASATISMLSDLTLPETMTATQQHFIFVNFGFSSTSVYLFDKKANIPLEIYNFPLGLSLYAKDLMVNYSLSEAEAITVLESYSFTKQEGQYKNINQILATPFSEFAQEIEKFLISIKNRMNIGVNNIIIFGEGMRINQFDKRIGSFLGLPVMPLDVYPLFTQNNIVDFFKKDLGSFVPSIGGNIK